MSVWKWVGAAAGGVGGFLVGGPAGAAAGAGLGYSAGSSADQSNARDDANAANNAAAGNIKVNPAAWAPQQGVLGSQPVDTRAPLAQQAIDEAQAVLDDLKRQRAGQLPNDPANRIEGENPVVIDQKIQQFESVVEQRKQALAQVQAEYNNRESQDATVAVRNMQKAQGGVAPTMGPTLITGATGPDFGRANDTLRQQGDFRAQQLAQAEGLQAGKGGEGQQALVDRLNSDMSGNQPSLAQLQLEEGRDAAINNSLSIANSARGNTQGYAQIAALKSNEEQMQQATRAAAMLRAEEYARARGEMGSVLSQKRGQDLQGQNIAATELGQGRQQDIGVAGIQSANSLSQAQLQQALSISQANLDQDTKKANLLAYFQQQGINNQMAQYWADKYTHYQERPQDLAIDQQKTQAGIASDIYHATVGQNNANLDRQQRSDAATAQGVATFGAALATRPTPPTPGVNGGTPGGPAPAPNSYTDNTIVDPWKKSA